MERKTGKKNWKEKSRAGFATVVPISAQRSGFLKITLRVNWGGDRTALGHADR